MHTVKCEMQDAVIVFFPSDILKNELCFIPFFPPGMRSS